MPEAEVVPFLRASLKDPKSSLCRTPLPYFVFGGTFSPGVPVAYFGMVAWKIPTLLFGDMIG